MKTLLLLALLSLILTGGAGVSRLALSEMLVPRPLPSHPQEPEKDAAAEALFRKIEEGIAGGDIGRFSQDFARQAFVAVRGKESGYFSANQSFLIVRNFFASRKLSSFRLSKRESGGSMPFATGGGTFLSRGTMESFQVYVALTRLESRWVIAQFNVY